MAIVRKELNSLYSRIPPASGNETDRLRSVAWCDIDTVTLQGTQAGIDNNTTDIAHTCVITRLDRNVSYTTTAQPGQHLTQAIPQNGNNRVIWVSDGDGGYGTPENLTVTFSGTFV